MNRAERQAHLRSCALFVLVAAGCANDPAMPARPDASSDARTVAVGDAIVLPQIAVVRPARRDVHEQAARFVADLASGGIVVLDDDRLTLIDDEGASELAPRTEIASPSCIFGLDGAIVIATTRGVLAIENGEIHAVSDADRRCLGAAAIDDDTVWIERSADEIELIDGGRRERIGLGIAIDPGSLRSESADVAWALSEGHLVEIRRDGPGFRARQRVQGDMVSIAVSDGAVLVARNDGTLWSGTSTSSLSVLDVTDVLELVDAGTAATWIHTEGAWFQREAGTIRRVDMAVPEGAQVLGAHDGSLIVSDHDGVSTFATRWHATMVGLVPGGELLSPRVVTIHTTSDTRPSIVATISGVDLPVFADAIAIDPAELVPGDQELTVELTWDDGTLPVTLHAPLHIAGEPPTWSDVEAIYLANCARCHGRAGARPLATSAQWRDLKDAILYNLNTSPPRMPKPPSAPLSALDLARVEAWFAAGAPE